VPEPNVYVDSTALISLARIEQLNLLALLSSQIRVTRHVWTEVASSADLPGTPNVLEARNQGLLLVVGEGDPARYPTLDPGESSVLSAALAQRAYVVMDERKARRLIEKDTVIRQSPAGVTGVLGGELVGDVPGVGQWPGKPIELADDQRVSRPHGRHRFAQAGTCAVRPGQAVVDEDVFFVHAEREQRVPLHG
jgi:predicted nucleic acid-binding protein